ncbi:MAG TPA: exodeoxyribonuclease VII small subunit [Lachnospiraceae bacterium]|nr:exodeoxyribonuclease VII small subunit [Lachnospiraceae bacterium]
MDNKEEKELTVEESFQKLDKMIKDLENPDVSLEDSFAIYEDGMKLLKDVSGKIDLVEKKIQKLDNNGETEDFE